MEERFPGELQTLHADNVRLRLLLALSEEQARAADADQATLTGAPMAPVDRPVGTGGETPVLRKPVSLPHRCIRGRTP